MDQNPSDNTAYLSQLYQATGGDLDAQVSMYDIGETLGIEKEDAGQMAQDLMVEGLIELKTLSGGVSITAKGLKTLNIAVPAGDDPLMLSLGNGPILEGDGLTAVETLLSDLKQTMGKSASSYPEIEEMVLDIKTIEVQMLSPKPKVAIIREIFKSLHNCIKETDAKEIESRLAALISS